MDLIIKVKDGEPDSHPILIENFLEVFPNVDLNNLPADFTWFKRIDKLPEGPYEEYIGTSYQKDEFGNFYDHHDYRQFTEEEKIQKQEQVKLDWANSENAVNRASWVFNPEICYYEPPIPYPKDGNVYKWNEANVSWLLVSTKPNPIQINSLDFT